MLEIGGYTPLSTTDWPGRLAAVVFIQGCPWRCHYCHNEALQVRSPTDGSLIPWPDIVARLQKRTGLLDGVVFSGGEPTLDPHLETAVDQVCELGFEAGLHSAGIYPQRLESLLPKLSWVGLDIKTHPADYEAVTATRKSGVAAWRSLQAVLKAGVDYEVRTTWHPSLIPLPRLLALARALREQGVQRWVLQRFRPASAAHAQLAERWRAPDADLCGQLQGVGLDVEWR